MTDRHELLCGIRTFTIGNVTVNGEDDLNNFLKLLDSDPKNGEAFREQLRGESMNETATMMSNIIAQRRAEFLLASSGADTSLLAHQPSVAPTNPMRLSAAIVRYGEAMVKINSHRTLRDKARLLEALGAHLGTANPTLGLDPFVHEIATHHLSAYLDMFSNRNAQEPSKTVKTAAATTLIKKISDLRSFFGYSFSDFNATNSDPTVGLEMRRKALKTVATNEEEHYDPFETGHLTKIFEPRAYLSSNRDADYFWAPLLGLHLGTRLKELVTLELANIQQHCATGLWFIDVTPENAKNKNSIRRLPIPSRLMQLGFIEYVEHARQLGAKHLFPHRNLTGATARNDPSKNCSRAFGNYLDSLDIKSKRLVFHSFRHTVVTALQDCGTPLLDSMQITGHQAQDHAIKMGAITAQQARSVHIDVYGHGDKARLNVEYPLSRLKEHLDRSIVVPLDYDRLSKAAAVVLEHTRKKADGFKSGWAPQLSGYTEEQIRRLG